MPSRNITEFLNLTPRRQHDLLMQAIGGIPETLTQTWDHRAALRHQLAQARHVLALYQGQHDTLATTMPPAGHTTADDLAKLIADARYYDATWHHASAAAGKASRAADTTPSPENIAAAQATSAAAERASTARITPERIRDAIDDYTRTIRHAAAEEQLAAAAARAGKAQETISHFDDQLAELAAQERTIHDTINYPHPGLALAEDGITYYDEPLHQVPLPARLTIAAAILARTGEGPYEITDPDPIIGPGHDLHREAIEALAAIPATHQSPLAIRRLGHGQFAAVTGATGGLPITLDTYIDGTAAIAIYPRSARVD